MNYRILSVIFETNVQNAAARFSIPAKVCQLLGGMSDRSRIELVIKTPSGRVIYSGVKKLVSGREIYGQGINGNVKPGEHIIVTASRPHKRS
jgi:hypothetical protein